MPPISKLRVFAFIILFLSSPLFSDSDDEKQKIDKKDREMASGKAISLSPVSFYQTFISPIDGARCQMWPSCSDYAKLAVEHNGKFRGILMTFDRLTRCGSDLHKYDTLHLEGRIRFYDYPGDIRR